MQEETKARSVAPMVLYAMPTMILCVWGELARRASRIAGDDRGLETLEYGLLLLVGVVVIAVAVNSLGGSIAGFLGRLGNDINGLG
jgi:Flp pilus assembly pilin Flp